MRLIDADKLYPDCLTKTGRVAISQSQIAEAPTVEERTTGEWIDRNGNTTYPFWLRYECSICHGHSDMANYCYHCGARMKGGEEE